MRLTASFGRKTRRKHFSLNSVVGGEEEARRTPRASPPSLKDFTRIKASSKALYPVLVRGAARNILREELDLTYEEFGCFWPSASNNVLHTWLVFAEVPWVGKKHCATGLTVTRALRLDG